MRELNVLAGDLALSLQGLKTAGNPMKGTAISARAVDINLAGRLEQDPNAMLRFAGQILADGEVIAGGDYGAQSVQGVYDGVMVYDGNGDDGLTYSGDLELTLKDASIAPKPAASLANLLTLDQTLSAVPVAMHFHDDFTRLVTQILTRADWAGALELERNQASHSVALKAPLNARARTARLSLAPRSGALLRFDAATDNLALNADLSLSGPRNLSVKDLKIDGPSDMGLLWSRITAVTADLRSDAVWKNQNVRLGPFSAGLDFQRSEAGQSALSVALGSDTGGRGLDYDGPLLGSDFTALKTRGMLRLQTTPNGSSLYYEGDGPMTARSVSTALGWTASDVSLQLEVGQPLLTRTAKSRVSKVALKASDLSARLSKDEGDEDFTLTARGADISGGFGVADGDQWAISLRDGLVLSDTVPGPQSRVQAPLMTVSLSRVPNSPWSYQLSSPALSADMSGLRLRSVGIGLEGADGDFTADYSGGTMQMSTVALPALPMSGQAVMTDGRLSGTAQTAMPRAPKYPIYAVYSYADGQGEAELTVPDFLFSPQGVQPQDLAPVLRGKVAAVSGRALASVKLTYRSGQPLGSEGAVTLSDMDIGTLAGPFTGVNTTLNFSSLVPLRSLGTQTITMTGFNAGLPLGAGSISFDVIEGGIQIHEASWPMGQGRVFVEPAVWKTSGGQNRLNVNVTDLDLGDMLSRLGNKDISATGKVNGVLPMVFDGVKVTVDNGRLAVKDGGVIRVRTDGLDAAAEKNETAKMAIDALKAFEYQALTLDVNGPLDGEIAIGVVFTGNNKKVLGGSEFLFRVNIEGELVNIARNLANNAQVQDLIRTLESQPR